MGIEDIRSEYVEDEIREGQIKHWEVQLNNSLHAVYVAQQTLDKLYRARYKEVTRELGHQALNQPEIEPKLPENP